MTTAERALRDARAEAKTHSNGIGQISRAVTDARGNPTKAVITITWRGYDQMYDIGNAAQSFLCGKRAVVLPLLKTLLLG